jgi:hypothetical protein
MALPMDTLIAARALAGGRRNAIGEIHRPTTVQTPSGGNSKAWAPVAVGLDIGIAQGPTSQNDYQQAIIERFGTFQVFFIIFPPGTDVRETDRVYQTAPVARTFEVVAVPNRDIDYEVNRRVIGVEIQ